MPMVTEYQVVIEGGFGKEPVIYLYDGSGALHSIKFKEPEDRHWDYDGMDAGGNITMRLASAMLEDVIDILRNEGPVYINYRSERASLSTSEEPVGEAE